MKKLICLLLVLIVMLSVFAGCGAATSNKADAPAEDMGYSDGMSYVEAPADAPAPEAGAASVVGTLTKVTDASLGEKMIYSANAEIETVKFDETIEAVYDMLEEYDAFIESTYISGQSYRADFYGYTDYRRAEYTIRVPVENFNSITSNLESVGHLTYFSADADNITAQFTDTESRLKAYRTEEDRLLTMMENAETVEDMITIETRLSQVQYEIESLTSQLRNWQNEVDYSTLYLTISEVEELTEIVETQRTYWEEMGDGLKATLKSIGKFFTELFKGIVIALPVLIIVAIIAAVVIIIIVKSRKKKKLMKQKKLELPKEDKKD